MKRKKHDSSQKEIIQLQLEKLVNYLQNSQRNEDVANQIADIEQKLQYQKQLVHKTGKN